MKMIINNDFPAKDAYGIDKDIFREQLDKWLEEWDNEMTFDEYLKLGEKLISTGKYEEASVAVHFIYSKTSQFNLSTFERLGLLLDNDIVNWGHTDVLSGMALVYFITSGMLEPEAFFAWTKSPSIWKRRAIPVTFVEIVKKDSPVKRLLPIIEPLMEDEAQKVQQGLGWFLREAWKKEPAITEAFLLKWKETCGRTIIQYATEKMPKEERVKYRRTKKK